MILFFIFVNVELATKIDSLESLLNQHPSVSVVLLLNDLYLQKGEFDSSINLLKKYENFFTIVESPLLSYKIGESFFFAQKLIQSHEAYLKLIVRFPQDTIANDALARLYLIEEARADTTLLKKLAYSIYLYETGQLTMAQDSLKLLLPKKIGAYAYYYLAVIYNQLNEPALALSALNELNRTFPDRKLDNAFILMAELYLKLGNRKDGQNILESLIVKEPNSIFGVRARKMLKDMTNGKSP